MTFDELGLLPELLKAVSEAGYTEPTPIQAQAIPVVLAGNDVMGGAQTGTGKTAGFVLPLLQRLARHASTSPSPARHPVRALILTPTRELAMQVHESVQTYGKYVPLRDLVVYGGVGHQAADPRRCERGVEIVVATPGRLLDHVQQKSVNFNSVEVLVLDEADRMLDMGFIPDIKRILAHAADGAAEPALLGHVLRRDQEARRLHAESAGADRSGAPQRRHRNRDAPHAPGRRRTTSDNCSPTCSRPAA